MISDIQTIVKQYEKHGWTLRRVLLSQGTRAGLADAATLESLFGSAPVAFSEIDAAWFSRDARSGGETWEIRRLGGTPFALVEIFDAETDESARDQTRREIERRLINAKR